MSSGEKRFPREQAHEISMSLAAYLLPCCERIAIAGSYRRARKPDVGDLEIVAIPVLSQDLEKNLFGEVIGTKGRNLVDEVFSGPVAGWTIEKAGSLYKRLVHVESGLPVDLYLGTARNWGGLLAIRTGPGEFSTALVQRARRLGYQVSNGYYIHRHPAKLDEKGKAVPCQFGAGCAQIIETPSEESFFESLQLPFISPDRRDGASWMVRRMPR